MLPPECTLVAKWPLAGSCIDESDTSSAETTDYHSLLCHTCVDKSVFSVSSKFDQSCQNSGTFDGR